MNEVMSIIVSSTASYFIGSIPTALLIIRWKTGIDVRSIGSGHVGATNAMRAAGWGVGILVGVLDVGKGYLAIWLTQEITDAAWAVVPAAIFVVIGHCWPVLAGFRGGMGMATTGGALLRLWPFGFVVALGIAVLAQLVIRHSARANFVTGLLIGPFWALLGAPLEWVMAAVGAGVMISVRATSDWKRVYRELWLDRET